jgi:hypothetical protein
MCRQMPLQHHPKVRPAPIQPSISIATANVPVKRLKFTSSSPKGFTLLFLQLSPVDFPYLSFLNLHNCEQLR